MHWPVAVINAANEGAIALRAQEELKEFPWFISVDRNKATIDFREKPKPTKKRRKVETEVETFGVREHEEEGVYRVLSDHTMPFLKQALEEMMPDVVDLAVDLARKAERTALDEAQQAVMPPEIRAMTPSDG